MTTEPFQFSALEGQISLHRARLGDLSIIVQRLRSDAILLPDERLLIAGMLTGDWVRSANRPSSLATETQNDEIKEAALFNRALDSKRRPGATRIAHTHGCSTKWVYTLLARVDADRKGHAAMRRKVARMLLRYRLIMRDLRRADCASEAEADGQL